MFTNKEIDEIIEYYKTQSKELVEEERNILQIIKQDQEKRKEEKPIVQKGIKEGMVVLITSASRSESFKRELEAFLEYVVYSGKFNFYLHEDVVKERRKESEKLVKIARDSGVFKKIYISDPKIGRGPALNMLKKHVTGKYVFYMEEDWMFVRYVNLDSIIDLMDKYPHINQISWNNRNPKKVKKPGGPKGLDHFDYITRVFDEHYLMPSERWNWSPSVWRNSFILPIWNFSNSRAGHGLNRYLKNGCGMLEWNVEWLEKKIGSYFYSSTFERPPRVWEEVYTYHLEPFVRNERGYL